MKRNSKSDFEGKIYPTRNGDLIVEKYITNVEVHVRFISTGYRKVVALGNVLRGGVKDPLYPSVYGVGYIGDGVYKTSSRRQKCLAYERWHSMLQRCYSNSAKPCYAGCSVDPAWHNYQVFAEWFYLNYVEGFELDKDISGTKVYSPDTCQFISPKENSSYMSPAREASVKKLVAGRYNRWHGTLPKE